MTDADLLALNVLEEAAGEIDDGRAAVARVVKNRMRLKFCSDGTVRGTVLAPDQFSWAYFSFVNKPSGNFTPGKHIQEYVRLRHTVAEAEAYAETLFKRADPRTLNRCTAIASAVVAGLYHGPLYDMLTDDAVSYINPRILTRLPTWAIPSRRVCSIGRHDFYRATDAGALIA